MDAFFVEAKQDSRSPAGLESGPSRTPLARGYGSSGRFSARLKAAPLLVGSFSEAGVRSLCPSGNQAYL